MKESISAGMVGLRVCQAKSTSSGGMKGESSNPFEGFPDVISNHLVLWNKVKAVEVGHWRGIEEE